MAVSVNQGQIQRFRTSLPVLDLCSAPLLLPTLKGPPIKDLLIQAMIPGMGVLKGITDDTIALTAEMMTGHALLTTDATRLINALETTTVNMLIRVLSVLRQMSTDKVTTMLPGTMMSYLQLLVRIISDHPLRMITMTDGCHHHPPLLS